MYRYLACLTLSWCAVAGAAGARHTISAEEWARPRSGDLIVRLPAASGRVYDYLQAPGSHLVIRYAGGEDGQVWAEELRAWLVALGIPSSDLELSPGAERTDRLELLLRGGGRRQP